MNKGNSMHTIYVDGNLKYGVWSLKNLNHDSYYICSNRHNLEEDFLTKMMNNRGRGTAANSH